MYQQAPPPPYPGSSDQSNGYNYQGSPQAYAVPVGQPVYVTQPVGYVQPIAQVVPLNAAPLLATSYTNDVPMATAVSLPGASDHPMYNNGGNKARDLWAALLFWAHLLAIIAVGFALGPKAVNTDSGAVENDPNRPVLHINAYTMFKVVVASCAVSAVVAAGAFALLKRAGGAMIRAALWINFAVLAIMAGLLCLVALPAGIIMAIPAVLVLVYIRCIRNRIEFAAAHLQAACDAVGSGSGSSIFGAALLMLFVQSMWNGLWSLAALGVNAQLSGNSTLANSTLSLAAYGGNAGGPRMLTPLEGSADVGATVSASGSSTADQTASIAMFCMLISFYWGSQVFANIMTFTTATVVGHWWFGPEGTQGKNPVWTGLKRAFTTSLGSIAFGSLIVAVLRALEQAARAAERNAAKEGKAGAAFAAACLLCLVSWARRATEYLNHWAYIFCALTGSAFIESGKAAWRLFMDRGWTAVINDDLVGMALGLSNLMVASISTATGAGLVYLAMASNPNRTLIAALAAVFSFVIGFSMSAVMNSVLVSATRTVFVCFALNPAALASTHPQHLATLASAWASFHPTVWASCGYAAAYPSSGAATTTVTIISKV